MKPTLKIKIAVDAAMSVSMLLLMAYGLVGEAAHEWIGMGMFALFVVHHVLNRRWINAVPRGRYTPLRIVQTALAGLIFLCMVGSMISGIVLSRHVFAFLPRHGGYELAGKLHILCAFWGFVLMSLHLGMHWNMLLTMARKHLRPNQIRTWVYLRPSSSYSFLALCRILTKPISHISVRTISLLILNPSFFITAAILAAPNT